MMSALDEILVAASAQRSVPLRQSAEVITTCPPKLRTASAIRSSSVATHTPSHPAIPEAHSQLR